MLRNTHDAIKAKMLADPEVRKEYEALNDEFELFREMLRLRLEAGKTQEDLAKALNTTTSAISRLENSGGTKHHSPSLTTLKNYARVLGYRLKIQFIHKENIA